MVEKYDGNIDGIVFPVIEDGKIREATRFERIKIYKLTDEIHEGEIITDTEIVRIEVPKNIFKPKWNGKEWVESATYEELQLIRKEKILKYAELKKEIEILEEFSEEFESDTTIEIIKLQLQQLKSEINNLLNIINGHKTVKNYIS